jgi:hypothetical protein
MELVLLEPADYRAFLHGLFAILVHEWPQKKQHRHAALFTS